MGENGIIERDMSVSASLSTLFSVPIAILMRTVRLLDNRGKHEIVKIYACWHTLLLSIT